jgi:hypothetical protein
MLSKRCTCREACELFIINDRKLTGLNIDRIDFIAGLDVNLY